MAERMQMLEDHADDGGVVAWFPEGQINRGDPHQVGMFRAGGFVLPALIDVEIWCIASVGNSICWPRQAAVGGRPCDIGIKIFQLCESSHDFVSSVAPTDKAQSILLANSAHDAIQQAVDDLIARGFEGA